MTDHAKSSRTISHERDTRTVTGFLRPWVLVVLALWGAAAVSGAMQGWFENETGVPVGTLVAVSLPPALFLALYAGSAAARAWVERADLGLLTAMQGWRVVGAAFLFVWAAGGLPAVFAAPAGFGDVAVGLAAPFVALAVWRWADHARPAAYGLIAAGMLDFVAAFATGILGDAGGPLHFEGAVTTQALGQLPLSLFPTYFVPMFIILHLMAWLKLRKMSSAAA